MGSLVLFVINLGIFTLGPHLTTPHHNMTRQLVELKLSRKGNQSWGLRLVGGQDVGTLLKVEKVLGLGSPASRGGVEEGDLIISIQSQLVTNMAHGEVVNFIKNITGDSMGMSVERGEIVVPNITDC